MNDSYSGQGPARRGSARRGKAGLGMARELPFSKKGIWYPQLNKMKNNKMKNKKAFIMLRAIELKPRPTIANKKLFRELHQIVFGFKEDSYSWRGEAGPGKARHGKARQGGFPVPLKTGFILNQMKGG